MRDIEYAIEEQVSSMAFFMTYMSNIVRILFHYYVQAFNPADKYVNYFRLRK